MVKWQDIYYRFKILYFFSSKLAFGLIQFTLIGLYVSDPLVKKISIVKVYKKSLIQILAWLSFNCFHDFCEIFMFKFYFYQFTYFCLDCYYVKLKADILKRRLKWVLIKVNSNHKNSDRFILRSMYRFNLICKTINSHNDYWKYYLFSFLSFHIVLDVLGFYVPNFVKESLLIKIYFYLILLTSLSTLLVLFQLGVSVSNSMSKFHSIFIKQIEHKFIRITTKNKVNNIFSIIEILNNLQLS